MSWSEKLIQLRIAQIDIILCWIWWALKIAASVAAGVAALRVAVWIAKRMRGKRG